MAQLHETSTTTELLETNVRIIRAPPSNAKSTTTSGTKLETIHGITKRGENIRDFNCQISLNDTLVTEESFNGVTKSIRLRQISHPPPANFDHPNYIFVTYVEISCTVCIPWVFSFVSLLPYITSLRFGSGSFIVDEFLPKESDGIVRSNLTFKDCVSLQELFVHTDLSKSLTKPNLQSSKTVDEHRNVQLGLLIDTVHEILKFTAIFCKNVVKADLRLPINTELDDFLNVFPKLRDAGTKTNCYPQGVVKFSSSLPNPTPNVNSISKSSGGPGPSESGQSDSFLGKHKVLTQFTKPPMQSPLLTSSIEPSGTTEGNLINSKKRRTTVDSKDSTISEDQYYDPFEPSTLPPSPSGSSASERLIINEDFDISKSEDPNFDFHEVETESASSELSNSVFEKGPLPAPVPAPVVPNTLAPPRNLDELYNFAVTVTNTLRGHNGRNGDNSSQAPINTAGEHAQHHQYNINNVEQQRFHNSTPDNKYINIKDPRQQNKSSPRYAQYYNKNNGACKSPKASSSTTTIFGSHHPNPNLFSDYQYMNRPNPNSSNNFNMERPNTKYENVDDDYSTANVVKTKEESHELFHSQFTRPSRRHRDS